MYYTFESFIDYTNEFDIVNEGFKESFSKFKATLVKACVKLVNWIETKVRDMNDSKLKARLLSLLAKAKKVLSKSKALRDNDFEMACKLEWEVLEIR